MNHYRIDSSYDGHAVTSLASGETYTYDENGNMIERLEGGQIYYQTFDAENRLVSVTVGGQTTQFVYDGDGNLVKKIKPDGSRTIYIGSIYEVDKSSGGAVTRTVTYYPAGGAMRIDGTVYYVLKDRLGSAYATTDASGNVVGEMRYYAFGETRLSTGTMFTDRLFTGQRYIAELGIYHFNARFYSPKLGRFLSADTLMSGFANPQSLNRFSYVANNPLRYTDPTGHMMCDFCGGEGGSYTPSPAPDDYCDTHPWACGSGGGDSGGGGDDGSEGSDGGGSGSGAGDDYCATHPGSCGLPMQPPVTNPSDELTPPNPSVGALVAIGILLTGAIVVTEIALVWAEIIMAPVSAGAPLLGVPLELVLVSASLALVDLDVAYWSYTYRVQQNPDVKQEFEILPPWGL